MATTEELLAQLEAEAQSEAPVCIIDPDTRTITVPPEYQLLGVENDKRVERLYFQCPKIVGDNQDLSQDYILFINYVNANGDPDAYKINDMQADGDDITFSWLLEEKVTLYQGSIQISFCGIIPGDEQDDPDKNRWGTTINTDCTVLTGLKCTQQVAESNPDALAQIWAAIDDLKAGGGGGIPGEDLPISENAKQLLITILKNVLYVSDQSQNIKNLQAEFGITVDTYSILYELGDGISCTNSQTEINNGESYYTQIISDEGYSISSVIVEMSNADITEDSYADGKINIESVTGNIKITVESVLDSLQDNMFDQGSSTDGYYCESTTGNLIQNTYRSVSDYIQVIGGKKYRIETNSDNSYIENADNIVMFDSGKVYKNFVAYKISAGSPSLLYANIEPDSDSYIRINLLTKYKDSTTMKEVKE